MVSMLLLGLFYTNCCTGLNEEGKLGENALDGPTEHKEVEVEVEKEDVKERQTTSAVALSKLWPGAYAVTEHSRTSAS